MDGTDATLTTADADGRLGAAPMRRPLLLALLVLALGGGLRLWATDHARFTGDESDYWAKSRRVATGDYLPIYGPEITGSAAKLPGPAYYYLMAAPQLLSPSPKAGSVFVVLLHLLAGWLLFAMAARARSERAGLIALVLFAFSPWDVLYADRIWGSCVVPGLGAIALYAAYRSRESTAWQGVLLFVSLVLPQLHLSTPVLWLSCLVLLFLRPPKQWGWRALGIALALTVLAYLAPLIAELRSGFANTQTILAKGGGTEPFAYAIYSPLRVLGYMVLYGTGEIGYHFARGYWGGGFDDTVAYLSVAGWRSFFDRHGPVIGIFGVVSVLLSGLGFLLAFLRGLGAAKDGLLSRARDRIDLEAALGIALFAGFVGGGLLLLVAKKRFFPHYANILMPMALFPLAAALDRLCDGRRLKIPVLVALAASATFMVSSTVRYYREIDSLNGMKATLQMVEAVLDDGTPSRVDFTHFQNRYAWNVVADVMYGQRLPHDGEGRVRWIVDNRARHEGELPDGGRRFGSVLMRRVPATGDGLTESAAVKGWRDIEVNRIAPDGTTRPCIRRGEACSYGDHPWQHFGPQTMQMGGASHRLLFMHPVQGEVVQASLPIPAGRRTVDLRYGLTDGACRSNNQTPVVVTVLDGDTALGRVEADNRPGLERLRAARTSTAASTLHVRIETADEGARIFGFDVTFR